MVRLTAWSALLAATTALAAACTNPAVGAVPTPEPEPATSVSPPTEGLPRYILAVIDTTEGVTSTQNDIHWLAEFALNYLGYGVRYLDVATEPLPGPEQMAPYAAIITWFQDGRLRDPEAFNRWLEENVRAGRKLLLMGSPGTFFDEAGRALPVEEATRALTLLGASFLGNFTDDPDQIRVLHKVPALVEYERSLDRGMMTYVEALAGFGIIVTLGTVVFPDQWGFLEVRPHPFWALVVFIPVMYGLAPGIFTGTLTLGLHLWLQWAQEPPSALEPTTPVLMLAAAVFIGEVRQRSEARILALEERSRRLEAAVEDLATRYTESEEARAILQRRILTQTFTFATLYDVARRLETLEEGEIPQAAAEVTARFLEADLVSVCFLKDGHLEVKATYLPDAASGARAEWLERSPVLRQCVQEAKAVSLRDLVLQVEPSQLREAPVVIAAPIQERDGSVVGVILVERIGFFQFTPTAQVTAATIARWTSQSLQAARLFRETRDRNIEDDLTGAYGSRYTVKRLREEALRARTFGFPLTVAILDIVRHQDISQEMLPKVLAVLGDVFRFKLGPVDILGRHPNGVSFVILFPHRDRGQAEEVVSSLAKEVEAFQFKPFPDEEVLRLRYQVRELTDNVERPEALIGALGYGDG